jgi:hypothetical protein
MHAHFRGTNLDDAGDLKAAFPTLQPFDRLTIHVQDRGCLISQHIHNCHLLYITHGDFFDTA